MPVNANIPTLGITPAPAGGGCQEELSMWKPRLSSMDSSGSVSDETSSVMSAVPLLCVEIVIFSVALGESELIVNNGSVASLNEG